MLMDVIALKAGTKSILLGGEKAMSKHGGVSFAGKTLSLAWNRVISANVQALNWKGTRICKCALCKRNIRKKCMQIGWNSGYNLTQLLQVPRKSAGYKWAGNEGTKCLAVPRLHFLKIVWFSQRPRSNFAHHLNHWPGQSSQRNIRRNVYRIRTFGSSVQSSVLWMLWWT